ncbi:MAG: hypothetical protein ACRYGK_18910 [Janthinobacterium lividum]
MDEEKKREMRTRQTIANAERLIAEVDETIARADRMFAQHQLDPANFKDFLKKNPNAAKMMVDVQKSIAEMAREMEQKAQRLTVQAQSNAPPPQGEESRPRPRRHRTMI